LSVIVSTRALRELLEIGTWIERDDADRAKSFVAEVLSSCYDLGDFPRAYAEAPEFGRGIRKRSHGNYLLLYRVGRRQVTIVSIRHAARERPPSGS
jgi:toxin ParE1/3/4